jgi:hypothetical protein
MLPKDTDTQIQLRDYYGLVNGMFYDELIRHTRENPIYLTKNLLQMSKK